MSILLTRSSNQFWNYESWIYKYIFYNQSNQFLQKQKQINKQDLLNFWLVKNCEFSDSNLENWLSDTVSKNWDISLKSFEVHKSKHVNFNMKSNFILWQSKNKSPVRVIAIFSNSIKFFRINPVFSHKIFWKSFNHTSTSIRHSQLLFWPEFLKNFDAIYKILTEKIEIHQIDL